MTMHAVNNVFDKKGTNLFRSVCVTDADRKKYISWLFEHQKGREHAKNSFGITHYQWDPTDPVDIPIADHPCSGTPAGVFSKRAIDALHDQLTTHGDLHSLKMDDCEGYYLFDCWSFVACNDFVSSGACDGGVIKKITVSSAITLPCVFMLENAPGLVVSDQFKQLVESNNLTGMVFSPVEIIFTD